jgi:peptide/nickel transport system ATP-binding protein
MQQRLLIAMALARGPKLLVMDEPTSALDPIFAAEVIRAVTEHARAHRAALLLVTHHHGVAAALTNRTIRLEAGRVVAAAPPAAVPRPPAPRMAGGATAGSPPALAAHDITVALGGATILSGVSLELQPGASLAIVGESGAGKSTLVRALLGLLPLAGGSIARAGRAPGFVSQDPLSALHPAMTCFEAIAEPLLAQGVAQAEIAARVGAIATLLGLGPQHLQRGTHALSVGQAQRACLARALVANASLVVFDEPLSALDEGTAGEVIAAIERARAAHGTAMLFVTHDLGFARRIAESVVVLRHGRVVEAGPAEAFFRAPRTPYARALVQAAREIGEVRDEAA